MNGNDKIFLCNHSQRLAEIDEWNFKQIYSCKFQKARLTLFYTDLSQVERGQSFQKRKWEEVKIWIIYLYWSCFFNTVFFHFYKLQLSKSKALYVRGPVQNQKKLSRMKGKALLRRDHFKIDWLTKCCTNMVTILPT